MLVIKNIFTFENITINKIIEENDLTPLVKSFYKNNLDKLLSNIHLYNRFVPYITKDQEKILTILNMSESSKSKELAKDSWYIEDIELFQFIDDVCVGFDETDLKSAIHCWCVDVVLENF